MDGSRGNKRPVYRLTHTMCGLLMHEATYITEIEANRAIRDILDRLSLTSMGGKHEVIVHEDYVRWGSRFKGDPITRWLIDTVEGANHDEEKGSGNGIEALTHAYPEPIQQVYLMMECGELIEAVGAYSIAGTNSSEEEAAMVSEMADVLILIAQMVMYMEREGQDTLSMLMEGIDYKVKRQLERLKEQGHG